MKEKKLMLGHKVRRLRKNQNLTQAQMAADLEISPAYLNLIEHNQRPVTAQVLVKLASCYDLDLATFAKDDADELVTLFREMFSEPIFESVHLSRQDFQELSALSPEAVTALSILSDRVRQQREQLQSLAYGDGALDKTGLMQSPEQQDPNNEVRDFFHENGNYFQSLEEVAAKVKGDLNLREGDVESGLVRYLENDLDIRVKQRSFDVMSASLRLYDPHQKRLLLNAIMNRPSRIFQIAVQYSFLCHSEQLDKVLAGKSFINPVAKGLAKQGLANYLAAAIMLPYKSFLASANELLHDIDLLRTRFQANREQVCHRLTTLQQPGARGIPFFLIRLDVAGNVSKRFSAGGFHFARDGGACPRWHIHEPPLPSMGIGTQIIQLPDGSEFFSLAIPNRRPGLGHKEPGQHYTIGLGCGIEHADKLIYAKGLDLPSIQPTPIGINCRLCERLGCSFRAFPPINHQIVPNEFRRDLAAFGFTKTEV